jgi:hypothetical protein
MTLGRGRIGWIAIATLALFAAGCTEATAPGTDAGAGAGASPPSIPAVGDTYDVAIDPAAFSTTIDNPYFPLLTGSHWVYSGRGEDGPERNVVRVTNRTREVMGVNTVVVKDTVWIDGELAELTFDWYAQDVGGTVWYFGEISKTYEHGALTGTEGSWEAGVNGALPGVVMPAGPREGQIYRQEFLRGEAEDVGRVLTTGASETVHGVTYDDVVVTEDTSLIEPSLLEHKTYAPGIGFVLESVPGAPDEWLRLVSFDGA